MRHVEHLNDILSTAKSEVERQSMIYEVLVNPFSMDNHLLLAFEQADKDTVRRAAKFASEWAVVRSIGLPSDPSDIKSVFKEVSIPCSNNHGKNDLLRIFCQVANYDLAIEILDIIYNDGRR